MNRVKCEGFNLLELLIAIALGAIIAAATISVYVSSATTNSDSLRGTRLSQELRGAMGMITRDLRRAGSWGLMDDVVQLTSHTELELSNDAGAVTATGTGNDGSTTPFAGFAANSLTPLTFVTFDTAGAPITGDITAQAGGTLSITLGGTVPDETIRAGKWSLINPFRVLDFTDADDDGIADNECIMYAYDLNRDGIQDANELFGFHRNVDADGVGAIRTSTAAANCADAGGWERLTDQLSTDITVFRIEDISPPVLAAGGFEVAVQEYQITLTGQSRNNANITRTVRQSVKVRNNFIADTDGDLTTRPIIAP